MLYLFTHGTWVSHCDAMEERHGNAELNRITRKRICTRETFHLTASRSYRIYLMIRFLNLETLLYKAKKRANNTLNFLNKYCYSKLMRSGYWLACLSSRYPKRVYRCETNRARSWEEKKRKKTNTLLLPGSGILAVTLKLTLIYALDLTDRNSF